MTPRLALQLILAIALAGAAFSGFLTWRELAGAGEAACTTVGEPGTILGYPPCVYGLAMYAALVVLALLGLRAAR
jgi:uncharacterized membrane protein